MEIRRILRWECGGSFRLSMRRETDDPELLKLTKMKKTFTVNGMKCVHCKVKVENALQSLEGVHTAVADLQQKNVVVDYDDTVVSVSNLKDAVGASGKYELVG